MTVSGNDGRVRDRAQRDEVVIAGVRRTRARRFLRIIDHPRLTAKQLDEFLRLRRLDTLAKLRIRHRALELGEQCTRGDELEGSVEPGAQYLGRGATRCEHRRDDDVGIENRPHRSVLAASSRVLGLDSKLERLRFTKIVPSPQPIEQVEAQVSPKGFLDDFAIALAGADGAYLHRAQHIFIDRQRGTRLCHLRIIAS